jgi:phosphodiesterase/alkaline phosphatase D-like protein
MSKNTLLSSLAAAALAGSGLAIASGAFASTGPTVTTGTASAIANTSATISGTVNPNGQATTYAFEYGTSTSYTQQTAVQSAGSGAAPVKATAELKNLQPGTTYHFRILAVNSGGTATGKDATFKTSGLAPPVSASPRASTAAATGIEVNGAKLIGTIDPAGMHPGDSVSYYFQLGPAQPYDLQTLPQTLTVGSAPATVSAQVTGLQSLTTYHYRLVAVDANGQLGAGADQTFSTLPKTRLNPVAVQISASPKFQRRMPDRVVVSGKLVPPSSLPDTLACRGYFDIVFRVGQIGIQTLRAGIHKDCTFSLPVVFHNRRRLLGGHVAVHVLFAGNRFLHRLEAPVTAIQVG